jgi:hypothetical protein
VRSDDFPSSGLRPEGLRSDGRLDEERELGREDGRPKGLDGRFSILTFPSLKTLTKKLLAKTKKGPQ